MLLGHDVVDEVGDFPEGTEDSFPESDEYLFEEVFFDDGFGLRDVVFDQVHQGAYVNGKVPAATTPMADKSDFIQILVIIKNKESL